MPGGVPLEAYVPLRRVRHAAVHKKPLNQILVRTVATGSPWAELWPVKVDVHRLVERANDMLGCARENRSLAPINVVVCTLEIGITDTS